MLFPQLTNDTQPYGMMKNEIEIIIRQLILRIREWRRYALHGAYYSLRAWRALRHRGQRQK